MPSSREVLRNHRKACLRISKKEANSSNIELIGHSKQLKALFLIHADFESVLKLSLR